MGEQGRVAGTSRRIGTLVVACVVFVFSWVFRFNDPGGSFAGLTDDHFFYLIRGWQILFGDLPVRDFVDHGAPLYYYVGAAVQWLLGRGTLSEVTFAVTVLSLAAALTFALAARASGSVLCALGAVFVHVLLSPRLYNYPKILVYAAAIPLIWRFADRPGPRAAAWVALVTAAGFLFRHDHGPYVAVAFATLLLAHDGLRWRDRARHAAVYALVVLLLLAPYLLFIQVNGGLAMYFREASAWAARDRERAPVVWPGLFEETADACAHGGPAAAAQPAAAIRANFVAWMFYLELALPLVALAALALSRDGFRPDWPRARPKLAAVAVLGIVLNAGFLRSPLGARLADPILPHTILLAWLVTAAARAFLSGRSLRDGLRAWALPARAALVLTALLIVATIGVGMSGAVPVRFEKAALNDGVPRALEQIEHVRAQLQQDWDLASWEARADRPDLIDLSLYLNACTRPDDRVFMQHYAPQVLALARRAFAGGHADLRPGFFTTAEAQQLTLDRLRRQRVPVVFLEGSDDEYAGFRESFPRLAAYFDEQYVLGGTRVFDRRFEVRLLVKKGARPAGTYEPFGWPCFSGT